MGTPLKNIPAVPSAEKTVTVLAVSPFRQDHDSLQEIFDHTKWHIYGTQTCEAAIEFLRKHQIAVVVCNALLEDGGWIRLLRELAPLPAPPLMIVTSEQADDSLWAEVLNLGAYDFLAKPFDRVEVTRVISLAWLQWRDEMLAARRKPAAASLPRRAKSATA